MLSNWLSKGTEIISVGAKTISQVSQVNHNNADSVALTKQILSKIQAKLNKQLGQNVAASHQSFNNQILKQAQLQKSLLEIKQKYNNLVSQSEQQSQCLKQMIQHFTEVLKNLGKALKNQDMFTPLKDIQSAFLSCNVTKVDKQLKYFSKLYEAALEDYLKDRLSGKQGQKRDEIALFKTLNKNLQVQLLKSRNNSNDLEKRLNEVHCRNQELMVKNQILEKLGAESSLLASNKEKQKFAERQNELLEKIKILEKQKHRIERINRQADIEVVKVNSAIEILKANQQNIVQELKREIAKKQSSYESILSKVRQEKLGLEDKIKMLSEELDLIKEELLQMKKKQAIPKRDTNAADVKDLVSKNKQLEEQISGLKDQIETLVSKDIMKTLFLSFEDESKEWSIRKNIKNQIYLLLDIKSKQAEKTEEKKWFGLF